MGNTRDLIKKIGDIKGTFNTNRGTIQDRNGKDLTEEEEIKKRWQEYMEELFKKGLNDLDNHDGMVTHLEPDNVQCEVKWILGSITTSKASGSFGIPGELFKILKDDAVKMLALAGEFFTTVPPGKPTSSLLKSLTIVHCLIVFYHPKE